MPSQMTSPSPPSPAVAPLHTPPPTCHGSSPVALGKRKVVEAAAQEQNEEARPPRRSHRISRLPPSTSPLSLSAHRRRPRKRAARNQRGGDSQAAGLEANSDSRCAGVGGEADQEVAGFDFEPFLRSSRSPVPSIEPLPPIAPRTPPFPRNASSPSPIRRIRADTPSGRLLALYTQGKDVRNSSDPRIRMSAGVGRTRSPTAGPSRRIHHGEIERGDSPPGQPAQDRHFTPVDPIPVYPQNRPPLCHSTNFHDTYTARCADNNTSDLLAHPTLPQQQSSTQEQVARLLHLLDSALRPTHAVQLNDVALRRLLAEDNETLLTRINTGLSNMHEANVHTQRALLDQLRHDMKHDVQIAVQSTLRDEIQDEIHRSHRTVRQGLVSLSDEIADLHEDIAGRFDKTERRLGNIVEPLTDVQSGIQTVQQELHGVHNSVGAISRDVGGVRESVEGVRNSFHDVNMGLQNVQLGFERGFANVMASHTGIGERVDELRAQTQTTQQTINTQAMSVRDSFVDLNNSLRSDVSNLSTTTSSRLAGLTATLATTQTETKDETARIFTAQGQLRNQIIALEQAISATNARGDSDATEVKSQLATMSDLLRQGTQTLKEEITRLTTKRHASSPSTTNPTRSPDPSPNRSRPHALRDLIALAEAQITRYQDVLSDDDEAMGQLRGFVEEMKGLEAENGGALDE